MKLKFIFMNAVSFVKKKLARFDIKLSKYSQCAIALNSSVYGNLKPTVQHSPF